MPGMYQIIHRGERITGRLARKKISGLYYSVILLEALNVISPHDDVISRLVEQVRVIKNSESVPENHEQVMNIIEKVVSDIIDL